MDFVHNHETQIYQSFGPRVDHVAQHFGSHLGSFEDYAKIRREISDLEKEQAQLGRQVKRNDLRQKRGVRDFDLKIANLKRELRAHPCHSCPDREAHARWAERYFRLAKETDGVIKQIESRTNQVAKTFDRISQMLLELGYFEVIGDDIESTTDGKRLAQIYGERDLLVSECLRQNCWERVDAPTLAALIAALVFEPRFEDESLHPKLPKGESVSPGNFLQIVPNSYSFLESLPKLPLW